MLKILERTSETVFVPLTVGGGVKDTTDTDGTDFSALDVARLYFKAGADKVSVGGDAVLAAEEYYARGHKLNGMTGIETISKAYGNQAVVVSVDPKKVYVNSPDDTHHHTIKTRHPSAEGQEYVWYQCTIKGGREKRDLDVRQLVQAVEAMGCGEILLNSIDKDGTNSGFDTELINDVKEAVKIPVIASSGAGNPSHFKDVFTRTKTDAALGAGMFHRREYTVKQVKEYLTGEGACGEACGGGSCSSRRNMTLNNDVARPWIGKHDNERCPAKTLCHRQIDAPQHGYRGQTKEW